MSQVGLTQSERIRALRAFGYSEREAAFLSLAGLHSGYFLRRQYSRFLGKESGGISTALIQKAVALNHVKASTYANSTCVYHLCTRPFYEAIGQADNRNRRERQPLTIKNRLMGLDFILDHPQHRFLATEQEKLDYSAGLSIDRSLVPTKRYTSVESGQSTTRYFVEKFPMFLAATEQDSTPTEVGFAFVDEGARTTSRFDTFLGHYGPLFRALSRFRLVYVAAGPLLFRAADRGFQRFLNGPLSTGNGHKSSVPEAELLEYFEARRLYESNDFSSFDRAKLTRFRDQRAKFSSAECDRLYARWKQDGDPVLPQTSQAPTPIEPAIHGTFSTHLLEHNYDLFGSLTSF